MCTLQTARWCLWGALTESAASDAAVGEVTTCIHIIIIIVIVIIIIILIIIIIVIIIVIIISVIIFVTIIHSAVGQQIGSHQGFKGKVKNIQNGVKIMCLYILLVF